MTCPRCQGETVYVGRWDADACMSCGWWVSEDCGDEDCGFCYDRPPSPLS